MLTVSGQPSTEFYSGFERRCGSDLAVSTDIQGRGCQIQVPAADQERLVDWGIVREQIGHRTRNSGGSVLQA
jgi:hypothetical protein